MIKKIIIAALAITVLFAGCGSDDVPDARDNIEDINIKGGNESVPFSEHSVKSSYSGNIEIDSADFDNMLSVIINGNEFTLGKSTVADIDKAFGLNCAYSDDLGCHVMTNGGYTMAMIYADNDKSAPINKITLCNLDKYYNVISFDYKNITDASDPDSVTEALGNATSYADSLNTKNRQWNYDNADSGKRVSFQMIWAGDIASQIELGLSDI